MILNQNYYKHRSKASVSDRVLDASVSEILEIAEKHLKRKPIKYSVLDVGCGSGEYSFKLAKKVKKVVGIEPFLPVYKKAILRKRKSRLPVEFINNNIEEYKTKQKFDVAISITTLEHMKYAEKSFRKIFALLNKGGVLYVTAPNKLWPLEAHYHLPFLSWLPLNLANKYMQLTGKGNSYEDCSYSLTYWGMKKFFDKFPCKYEFIVPKDANVGYLGCGEGDFFYKSILKLGIGLIKFSPFFWNISKGFVLVAVKK